MLKEGDNAPDFALQSNTEKEISLNQFKGKSIILYFYPKDNTPGCTTEACDFRDNFNLFTKKDVIIFGISKDSIPSHQKFITKHTLPFLLLSDPEGKVCELYGVWKEKVMYGKRSMGIERSTFVIGPEGTIKHVFRKVKVKDHITKLLDLL